MFRNACIGWSLFFAATAIADDSAEYQIHGFASQGLTYTDRNNLFGDSQDGSFELRELGINAYWHALDNLSLAGQLVSRQAGELEDGDPRIDFMFADWTFFEGSEGTSAGLRLGRVKNPIGFFNETRDVLFTRPSILLPQSLYYDGEGLRSLLFSMDGGQLYAGIDHGSSHTEVTVNYSINFDMSEEEKEALFRGPAPPVELNVSRFWVSRATTDWNGGLFRTAATVVGARFSVFSPFAQTQVADLNLVVLSGRWNRERFSLFGEYTLVAFYGDANNKTEGAYLQADYRLTPTVTAFTRYDVRFNNRNDRDGREFATATGEPAASQYSRDTTVGARWNVSSNWSLAAELHAIEGTASVPPLDNLGSTPKEPWHALLIMAGFRF